MSTPEHKLLPCPFCGAEAEYDSCDRKDVDGAIEGYDVSFSCENDECPTRPAVHGPADEFESLREKWNTRAALRAPEATVSAYGEYTPITVRASSAPNVDKGPLYDSRNPNYGMIGGLRAPEAGEAKPVAGRFDNLMGMLRRWRDADHADNITLGRSQIIDLIEGVPAAPVSADAGLGMSREEIAAIIDPQAFAKVLPASAYNALKKADAILALLSQRPAAEAEILDDRDIAIGALNRDWNNMREERDAMIERCADVAKAMREKHGSPTGDAYSCGVWDQGVRIEGQIRALAAAPQS